MTSFRISEVRKGDQTYYEVYILSDKQRWIRDSTVSTLFDAEQRVQTLAAIPRTVAERFYDENGVIERAEVK